MSTRTQRSASRAGDQATMASVIGETTTDSSTRGSTAVSTTTGTTRTGDTSFRGNTAQHQPAQGDQRGGDLEHRQDENEGGEPVGFFQRSPVIIPATVVISIIVAFGLMMLLNWLAGGGAPFTR